MKKTITMLIAVTFSAALVGQDTIHYCLPQLIKADRVHLEYVNFDFLKFMPGHGWSTADRSHGYGPSFEVQVLYPFALLKDAPVHIAWGVALGWNSIAWKNTALVFRNGSLEDLTEDNSVNRAVQKTGYAAVRVLPFFQVKKMITVMVGGSVHFNVLGNKVIFRGDEGRYRFHSAHLVNKVTVPLIIQISHKINTVSVGVFARYSLTPVFSSPQLNNIRQVVAGISGAIIL